MAAVTEANLNGIVSRLVQTTPVIDVHTHLFPPSHGQLLLWGVDELLTYHYLVAEYFCHCTAPPHAPDAFLRLPKREQADLIWQELFVQHSPISEACRGVLTTLRLLGLEDLVGRRDLQGIRDFYDRQRARPGQFLERVFRVAGIDHAVMTNVPYDPEEAQWWLKQLEEEAEKGTGPSPSTSGDETDDTETRASRRLKAALRVDQLLAGDERTIGQSCARESLPDTTEGRLEFLARWVGRMRPIYLMASTPAGFRFPVTANSHTATASGGDSGDELLLQRRNATATRLIDEVLVPTARRFNLPLALKVGASRGVNPALGSAGDGLDQRFDLQSLASFCRSYPDVKVLFTVLGRHDQHAACVLARAFPNLHLYGCWWFCNNPSIIEETTRVRLEMLGTSFTAQHSDARVLDQLLYKWHHARRIIAEVLEDHYRRLLATGWRLTEPEVARDVRQLLGGSYLDFLDRKLAVPAPPTHEGA